MTVNIKLEREYIFYTTFKSKRIKGQRLKNIVCRQLTIKAAMRPDRVIFLPPILAPYPCLIHILTYF